MFQSAKYSGGGLALLLVALLVILPAVAGAIPPRPTPFDENGLRVAAGEPAAMDKSADSFPYDVFNGRNPPSTGTMNMPVLLVDFLGQSGQITPAQFNTILFTPSAGGNTSVRDYYTEVSRGQLTVTGQIYGWLRMPMAYGSYVGGQGGHGDTFPFNIQGLVRDAVLAADASVDFRQFDNDGPDGVPNSGDDDGFVDCVYVIFSGYGAESYWPVNSRNRLWSSAGWMDWGWFGPGPVTTNDGVRVQLYAVSSELRNTSGNTIRDIGVVCHEMGHLLGLPDMYSTIISSMVPMLGQWNGMGEYSVMAMGAWGASGTNPDQPTHFTGFEKAMLGWLNPVHVTVDLVGASIGDIETSGTIYCNFPFWPTGPPDLNLPQRFWMPSWTNWPPPIEGFIVENRQCIGFDSQLSGSGLLIYHMDGIVAQQDHFNGTPPFPNWYSNAVEWSENRPLLDLECADQTGMDHTFNADDLDAQNNWGDAGDYFASTTAGFDATTTPSSVSYNGAPSGFAVRNIGASGAVMTADITVGAPPGPGHDIWVKDCGRDTGVEPSSPVCDCWGYRMQYACPDLWIDNNEDGYTDTPVEGATNKLHIKIRNGGTAGLDYGTVTVYDHSRFLAPPQISPDPGNPFFVMAKVCSLSIQSLAAGDSLILKVPWFVPASPPPPNWNYPPSLGVVVETATDTLNGTGDIAMDNNLAMTTGKKMWIRSGQSSKRGHMAEPAKLAALRDGDASFEIPPPRADKSESEPQPTSVVLPLNNPFDVPHDILFTVEGDIPPSWTIECFLPELMPGAPVPVPFVVVLDPGQVTPLEVVVTPDPLAMHGELGTIFVAEYDPITFPDEMLGGMSVPIEVDLYPPQPVTGLWAETFTRDSCVPWYGGVLIGFDPVEYDVAGFEESEVWYGAWRDTVLGGPYPGFDGLTTHVTYDLFWDTPWWEVADVDFPIGWPDPPHYYLVALDAAGNRSEISAPLFPPSTADYATHDLGAVRMTVTNQGICGYMEVPGRGQGLQYPKNTPSCLWNGGLWVGTGPTQVANRDYTLDPDRDWEKSDDPDGAVQYAFPPNWTPDVGDNEAVVTTHYRDTGSTSPLGLLVQQVALVSSDAPNDDFVILRYEITNDSDEPLNGIYAGQFMDLDLGDPAAGAPWNNNGVTDLARNLAVMWADDSPVHVGLRLLEPSSLANGAFIQNSIWVYPQDHILEADKFGFLTGSDPGHAVQATTAADDWGVCISAGPFNLAPNASVVVAIAVVGGDDLVDFEANADAAAVFYGGLITGVDNNGDGPVPARLAVPQNRPNPFNPMTRIVYYLPCAGRVEVGVFDLRGRRVTTLVDEPQAAGTHELDWDAASFASGVYLLQVRSGGEQVTRKMSLVR